MNRSAVFILGGAQSDFARNWNREGKHLAEIMRETVLAALESSKLEPSAVQSAHVGNFTDELRRYLRRSVDGQLCWTAKCISVGIADADSVRPDIARDRAYD